MGSTYTQVNLKRKINHFERQLQNFDFLGMRMVKHYIKYTNNKNLLLEEVSMMCFCLINMFSRWKVKYFVWFWNSSKKLGSQLTRRFMIFCRILHLEAAGCIVWLKDSYSFQIFRSFVNENNFNNKDKNISLHFGDNRMVQNLGYVTEVLVRIFLGFEGVSEKLILGLYIPVSSKVF